MERSQSCSSFETSTNKTSASLIRNVLEFTTIQQCNSQEHLSNSAPCQSPTDFSNASISLRRKTFQRQRSATFSDDTDYAGDLEEDDDDDEVMSSLSNAKLPATHPRHRLNYQPTLPSQPEIGFKAHLPEQPLTQFSASASSLNHPHTHPNHHHHHHQMHHQQQQVHFQRFSASTLVRDNSIHSDSSRYSSVDSLLEARKPDPEAILINLGFGPAGTDNILSRIPRRFLKPSKVKGNDTEAFVKRLQLATNLADHSALGYRGLTGNPDIPPSFIVAKIMQRFEVNERKKSMGSIEQTM